MTEYEPKYEFDDELLSAYLDDELSVADRAAVEARLAADPAARAMLHELRAVSQAVQSLPQEVVGHDLGETVLQRVEQSKHVAEPTKSLAMGAGGSVGEAPTMIDRTMPSFSIGRTRRGWFWASMAVAASLVIMVIQSNRETNDNLGTLAQVDNQPKNVERGRAPATSRELELRAVTDSQESLAPAAPAPGDNATDSYAFAPETGPASGSAARPEGMLNAPAAAAPTPNQQAATGRPDAASTYYYDPATQPPAAAPAPVALSTSTAEPAVESLGELSEQAQPVVVRVLARRDALRSKTFDRLLESNGIAVDEPVSASGGFGGGGAGGRVGGGGRNGDRGEETRRSRGGNAPAAEDRMATESESQPETDSDHQYVLVEAPEPAIASCMESLNRDTTNYLAIQVGDTAPTQLAAGIVADEALDKSTLRQESVAKQVDAKEPLTRYNRGIVSQQADAMTRDELSNFRALNESNRYQEGRGSFGGYGVANEAPVQLEEKESALLRQRLTRENQGQARRIGGNFRQQLEQEQVRLGRGATAASATAQPPQLSAQAANAGTQAAGTPDRVQVLFVLSPADEQPATSPPAQNKAQ